MSAYAPPPPPPVLSTATLEAWPAHLEELAARLRAVFPFRKTHRRALAYIEGLLGAVPRKNSWPLAELQGEANPYGSGTCWGGRPGRRTRRGTNSWPTRRRIWAMPTAWP